MRFYPKIIEYVNENHFEIESVLYEESLIDETTESDPNNYITQISVRIKEIFKKLALITCYYSVAFVLVHRVS